MKSNFSVFAICAFVWFFSQPHSNASDPIETEWKNTGNMLSARTCHTSTLLPDGRVLIAGGYNGKEDVADVELYNPKKGTFSRTGGLQCGRSCHSATLLKNGEVLVVGGQSHGVALTSAELYNPKTGVWTSTDSLKFGRTYHTATLLPNGQVLVAGGSGAASPPCYCPDVPIGSATDTTELYDPASGKWTSTGRLFAARYEHAATLLNNGQVLVTGGISDMGAGTLLTVNELYDPISRSWKTAANLPIPLALHTSTLLPNGSVLIVGGKPNMGSDTSKAEIYDPQHDVWTAAESLHFERNSHTATLLPSGLVLIIGGASGQGVLKYAELYNPKNGKWKVIADLNSPHTLHASTLLSNGQILVTGGLYENGSPANTQTSAELYPVKALPVSGAPSPSPAPSSLPAAHEEYKTPFD